MAFPDGSERAGAQFLAHRHARAGCCSLLPVLVKRRLIKLYAHGLGRLRTFCWCPQAQFEASTSRAELQESRTRADSLAAQVRKGINPTPVLIVPSVAHMHMPLLQAERGGRLGCFACGVLVVLHVRSWVWLERLCLQQDGQTAWDRRS